MPVTCYQVAEFEQVEGQSILAVSTFSLAPPNTNVESLLRLVAPSTRLLGPTGALFDPTYRYAVIPSEMPAALALLSSHRTPTVTAITSCALSACLDFYAHPEESSGAIVWKRTEVGALVYSAKYGGTLRQSGPILATRVTDFIAAHPVMKNAVGIAGVPSSQALGTAETGRLVGGIALWASRELGIPLVRLERTMLTKHSQKNLPRSEDPDGNQAGTMRASIERSGLVLVIDDLMRDASTVHEATRALLQGGATSVASLTLAKERTGTRRYQFS